MAYVFFVIFVDAFRCEDERLCIDRFCATRHSSETVIRTLAGPRLVPLS